MGILECLSPIEGRVELEIDRWRYEAAAAMQWSVTVHMERSVKNGSSLPYAILDVFQVRRYSTPGRHGGTPGSSWPGGALEAHQQNWRTFRFGHFGFTK